MAHQLLSELGYSLPVPPTLMSDNLSATHLSLNHVLHSKMKHIIQIDIHFVRDLVKKGTLTVHQLADLLTKPLSR